MPIILDHQLREYIPHSAADFPITYFHDELAALPDLAGPLHWHPDFEIASAECSTLDYQVGEHNVTLRAGDSIFVNGNVLHGIKQVSGDIPDPMPNIVFSGSLIAPETSTVFQRYVQPIARCDSLPFVVFRHNDPSYAEVNRLIGEIYKQMREQAECYELVVQRCINSVFEFLSRNFSELPGCEATRIQISNQVRLQKMLSYIYENYSSPVTLDDIASAADISRSEAGRCFRAYMGCSPVDALIRHRLETAWKMLGEGTHTLQQISYACGFNSVNYFSRQFRKRYGYSPGQIAKLGK